MSIIDLSTCDLDDLATKHGFAVLGIASAASDPDLAGRLDAFLALTSSGPAYVALMAEAMADGAVAVGMPRAQAHHLAHRTLAGTAALLHEQQLHPAALKDMVASPGGTTMAALRQLEKAGLRSALIEAVIAATQHGRGMAN